MDRKDAVCVLNLGLDVSDGVGPTEHDGDGFAVQRAIEELHTVAAFYDHLKPEPTVRPWKTVGYGLHLMAGRTH